jgi:signal transduction histidine kinase
LSHRIFPRHGLKGARNLVRGATFYLSRPHRLPRPPQLSRSNSVARAFGNLRVRPKLIVLHNLFFLALACAAYFSVIPLFDRQVFEARTHEIALLRHVFSAGVPIESLKSLESHDFRQGSAAELAVPATAKVWLDSHSGDVWADAKENAYVYQKDPAAGTYRRLRIARLTYREVVDRAQLTLFLVLGSIYIAAVLLLETAIMPLYVYGPLRVMLDADQATHRGDRERELIPEEFIFDDEVGQIMRSRNATVAELREHEDNLAAAIRKLEEQDRLASLGLLSASVAHELNTPLAVLHGSIEKLKETTTDPHTLERLSRMERVTQKLRRISESLVDFARQRKQVMEPLDLRPIVEEAWHLVAIDERAADVKFRNEVRAGEIVTGNPDRLIQVFVNLLRNALHAVKSSDERPTGEIAVTSRPISANGRSWISIKVEDNGPGIPPDVLPEIFEAFVTTRLDARGTGLGLTVSEGIVSQHGGTISAGNRPERGACIEVRLPPQASRSELSQSRRTELK